MTSEFLQGALGALRPADEAGDAEPAGSAEAQLRIRRLVDELLELAAQAREEARQLERERDALRAELDAVAASPANPPAEASPSATSDAGTGATCAAP